MEMLPLHGCGQSYGFVLYRALISSQAETITVLQLSDYGVVMILYLLKLCFMFYKHEMTSPSVHDHSFLLPLLPLLPPPFLSFPLPDLSLSSPLPSHISLSCPSLFLLSLFSLSL